MPAVEWTSHYATLYRNYLAAAPEDSGIPDLTVLPKRKQDDTAKLKRPRIIVTCEARESNHRAIFAGRVKITLGIQLTKDGEEPAEAALWLAAIDAWLRDEAKWKAFIQSLSIAERTGWAFMHAPRIGPLETDTDEEKHTRDFTIPLDLRALAKR